ncbi:MAG: hypothetical protein A3C30_02055 [Candidatus Levybacteria bacterium RIFCSPHIGHO2_02_FULL_40_18]|nr:MAG: hypothetical protein A2869_04435 [Candidatus Levybacteria bacterium RIFCSPHIGHO2_01_FULL_40_58]OGH26773.1 MAG: hypothetical protein A3C30_02055 [Candidatus Levybacteria bacterium RIFCSPHIGHO2_02_FULL_40_18]OGH31708.1 MAG: hypothetical protein A3E43_01775 [Candidatus Levybacteria bacterium RIFCSPHIGHO2_12_FULL_40_31]OGH40608.1 MAG: hypothetical protein A2894_00325 [Candidatus Levybacteria bacterium RIFCSPLOWO2_01_FULL_40_64]OGH48781.1 MAG: hypothetical protein A3I54_03950 [Candidatus Lev
MKKKFDNTSYIKLFILIVLFTAFVSISYKAFLLVKNRSFRASTFNIMLVGRDVHIVGFNIPKKQIHVLEFSRARDLFSRKKTLSASLASGVPLDGMIISIQVANIIDSKNDIPTFAQTLSFLLEDEKYVFYGVNKFDLIKLYIVSELTSWEDKSFDIIQNLTQDFSEDQVLASKIGEKFRDSEIFNEKTSIEIVNSTEIDGLGGRLGFILSNIGANVISIKDGEESETKIEAKKYDIKILRRIERLVELKAQKEDNTGIADVTINLGKDLQQIVK